MRNTRKDVTERDQALMVIKRHGHRVGKKRRGAKIGFAASWKNVPGFCRLR